MADLALDYERLTDRELAALVVRRDSAAVRLITKRNNQRLYRAAWSVLKNRDEAQDAVQEGYLKAFAAIGDFAGQSSLSTWLTRIVINEALGRLRTAQRRSRLLHRQSVAILEDYRETLMAGSEMGYSRKRMSCAGKSRSCSSAPSPSFRIFSAPCSCCATSRA
jgi:RNA polymerase sigma-70 factor (ECF subfamily)